MRPVRWLRQWRWHKLAPWSTWGDDFPDKDVPLRADGNDRLVPLYTADQILEAIEKVRENPNPHTTHWFESWQTAMDTLKETLEKDTIRALTVDESLDLLDIAFEPNDPEAYEAWKKRTRATGEAKHD